MKTIFEIYEKDKDGVVCDGYNRDEVIEEARRYFEELAAENGEYGEDDREVVLCWDDCEGITHEEKMVLTFYAERDYYDDGRADFYASRGCKHG